MSAFSSSAFSTSAFSELAFDFGSSPPPTPEPSAVPTRPYKEAYAYLQPAYPTRFEEHKDEAKNLSHELALAEQQQQETLERLAEARAERKQERAIKQLMAAQAQLEQEIGGLRIERARLMRMIDDEEAILVLLLSLPLH